MLAIIGAVVTAIYPYMKRFTHLPQLGLGIAFSWGVPMAFAAQLDVLTWQAWIVFAAAFIWPVIYDSMYAMVDKQDDIKIGVKSTAIWFGDHDRLFIGLLQILFIIMQCAIGWLFALPAIYYASVFTVALLFFYQQWLIKARDPQQCFRAFLNNNVVGLVLFAGIFLSYYR